MNMNRLGSGCLAAALFFGITGAARSAAFAATAANAVPAQQQFEGTLQVVWGDPHPANPAGGAARYTLVLSDGTSVALQFDGNENLAINYFGKRVVASGQMADTLSASGPNGPAQPAMIVKSIVAASGSAADAAAQQQGVFGTKRVLFLLLKFSDDQKVPHPPQFYDDMTNPDTPPPGAVFPSTINGFFKKTSDNQFSWIADVGGTGGVPAADWLTLPFPKSHYAPCGWDSSCADINAIGNDGMAAMAAQGIDVSVYDNVNFVLSNDLDCCAWGGSFVYKNKTYGATWEPPWGQNTSTYAHEMGHSLGLPHSGWVYYAYDSPWDVMSKVMYASRVTCGSYFSDNSKAMNVTDCSEPGDGYIAAHKERLGWFPPSTIVTTDAFSSVTVTLEGSSLPVGDSVKMLKVCMPCEPCTGSSAHYLTVEARVHGLGALSQFDNGVPGEGVLIHDVRMDRTAVSGPCFFNNQSGWAMPIDATPGDWEPAPLCAAGPRAWPNLALANAEWLPGQKYADQATGIQIEVQSRVGSSYVVSVQPCTDAACAAPANPALSTGNCGCGDGVVSGAEECDDGSAQFVAGDYCTTSCMRVPCGCPLNDAVVTPTASDALFALHAAVGGRNCDVRVCDVNNDTKVTASDALMLLRAAVGQSVALTCPR